MIILPAIDIKDGNCVRLFKGDFSTAEKVAADYMETAKGFEKAGASWIHMVDLDGAKEGRPVNTQIYKDLSLIHILSYRRRKNKNTIQCHFRRRR